MARGRFREDDVLELLTEAPYPARNPVQNIADLKAQVAANEKGAAELRRWCGITGSPSYAPICAMCRTMRPRPCRRVIAKLKNSRFEVETDQGSVIKVAIKIDNKARKATVDFTGTSAQVANTFNAPEPITRACVLYVFRTLVDEEIPLKPAASGRSRSSCRRARC